MPPNPSPSRKPDFHDIRTELLIQKLAAIRDCANQLRCNHPPDDGSDDPCDGEDCIKCYLLSLTEPEAADAPR